MLVSARRWVWRSTNTSPSPSCWLTWPLVSRQLASSPTRAPSRSTKVGPTRCSPRWPKSSLLIIATKSFLMLSRSAPFLASLSIILNSSPPSLFVDLRWRWFQHGVPCGEAHARCEDLSDLRRDESDPEGDHLPPHDGS
jgi:hypothetical protein